MTGLSKIYLWKICLFLTIVSSFSLDPLEIHGNKFFDTGSLEEVVIKGIDYYPRPNSGRLNQNSVDYYTEEYRSIWERDIAYLEELGVNAIRLYAVDPAENHDSFMCALEAVGIYVIVALAHDCPTCAITRDKAEPSGECYPPELKAQGQEVIKKFSKYENTLAFSAGNEVNHFAPSGSPEWNAPCQKKFIRDMREFISLCSHTMRRIPVGLVAADSDREANAMYYNCQDDSQDPFENAEWYGLNTYVMCNGEAKTYEEALGLKKLQESFSLYNLSIPVLLTEFGCLSNTFPTIDGFTGQRNFNQALWLTQEDSLRNVFAGGFAFEYSMEKGNGADPFAADGKQNYGIGYFGPEDCDDLDTKCEYHKLPSFEFLKKAFEVEAINVTSIDQSTIQNGQEKRSECPEGFAKLTSIQWEADRHPFSTCPSRREIESSCSTKRHSRINSGHSTFGTAFTTICLFFAVFALGTAVRYNGAEIHLDEFQKSAFQGSDESTGLLSLKAFMNPKSPYHSIDSDSSSEDLVSRGADKPAASLY